MNGQVVGGTRAMHPQTALLHNLLQYDDQYQEKCLISTNAWMKDRADHPSFMLMRHQFIEGSRRLKLYGRLNYNFFTTKQLLLPGIDIDINLQANGAEFCLIRSPDVEEEYKMVINDCKLHVRHVLYRETALVKMNKLMSTGHIAKYPYTETVVHNLLIPAGSASWTSTYTLGFGPQKPQRVYFTITDVASVGGSWENNPMVFPAAKYKLCQLEFCDRDIPLMYMPYKFDFDKQDYGRPYSDLLRIATEGQKTGHSPGINANDFMGDYGIFAIDNIPHDTNMIIKARFKEVTPCHLCAMIFVQYESYYIQEKSGNIKGRSHHPSFVK